MEVTGGRPEKIYMEGRRHLENSSGEEAQMALRVFEYELLRKGDVVSTGKVEATNIWHAADQLTDRLWNEQNLRIEELVIRQKPDSETG